MFKTRLDVFLGTICGIFGILKIFWFFENISKTRPSMEHWANKIFQKKLPQNVFKTRLRTFGNDFGQLWNFEIFSIFWKHFEYSTVHGTLGKKIFSKKLPHNMFKTLLDNLGTILGIFGILKIFDFLRSFRGLDPTWNTGKKNFSKSTPKLVQNTFGQFGKVFGHFWKFEKFLVFLQRHFEDSTLHGTLGKKFFSKKLPRKHVQNTFGRFLGTIFGIFGNLKFFWFFENISKTRPSMVHWAKKFFKKNSPKQVQNTFGHFWERLWAFLEILKNFRFFETISKTRSSMEHWAKKNFEKSTSKHVQNAFAHFCERFRAFLELWKFFDFLKTFRRLDPPCNTAQREISGKSTPKHVQNTFGQFGNNFGHFWNFENFWFFENISKTRPSMEHWAKKTFSKKVPQNLFETLFLDFWIFLKFFQKHFEDTTLHGTLGKKLSFENINRKHVQDTFGQFWERFWAILQFWKFFDFLKTFQKLYPPWNTEQKKFSNKLPQNMFKTRLDNFGNDFGLFWNFEKFWYFENISKTRPYMEHWAKKLFEKYPKTCWKHFWTVWERFWAFLENLKIIRLFENISKTRPCMEHWAKKTFRKLPQNMLKALLDSVGTILGIFGKFENCSTFWKHFEDPTLHGTLGKKQISEESTPKHVQGTFGQFGSNFGRFWNFESFLIFWKHFEDSTLHRTLGK